MQHNRKLLATFLLSVIALALCAAAFAGCHRHNHAGYEEKQPTCEEDGYVKYWCTECGDEFTDESYIRPATGHRFDADGYCGTCGEPDLSNPAFGSAEDGLGLRLTESGVLSWNRISTVSKYELSITYFGDTEATVYTLDKKTASVNLDELDKQNGYGGEDFPAGKSSAKFTPYAIHKETVDGEVIEQEYPLTELADEFKVVKLNGRYEIIRMTYADENLTLKGFYSDVKEDVDGNEYYLYELLLKDNKATQFYIKNYVQLKSSCKAQYYRTAQDRSSNANAVSDMDLRFTYVNVGGNNVFYARVTLAEGGYKDYDLHIYGLQTLKLQRYEVTSATGADGFRNDTYTQIGSDQTYIEGDILPAELLFAGVSQSNARDVKYNLITKADDFVMTAPAYGDSVKIYFGNNVSSDCDEYGRYSAYYDLTETDYGWQLYADGTKKEMVSGSGTEVLPYRICGKKVLSYSFNNVNATTLTVPQNVATLNISLTNCAKLTRININSPQTKISKGAFAGAADNLVIYCNFSSADTTNFENGWNAKSATNAYAGSFTVKYTDT
ncbi:MAG: leucine-rich repeat domain-containing protein [Clostridia bacterium]|nr:leucine-rich repeat domain-containing protein [Clostridia bacterium]